MILSKKYTPIEMCEIFDISKSTLFRWEKEKGFPPVERDLAANEQRLYTSEHIHWIGRYKIQRLTKQYEKAARAENKEKMKSLQGLISVYKTLYLDNDTGLFELEFQTFSPEMIKKLLLEAARHDSSELIFQKIIGAIYKQTVTSKTAKP